MMTNDRAQAEARSQLDCLSVIEDSLQFTHPFSAIYGEFVSLLFGYAEAFKAGNEIWFYCYRSVPTAEGFVIFIFVLMNMTLA